MNKKIEIMRNVLREEAAAINSLADSLDEQYCSIIDQCERCNGKIILTGMGKSGHVARKISATLSSLGTPSFFLHPAEAAHGDLGMVQKNDLIIMISKSGETEELIQLINSFKIIGCTLIGVFCDNNSTLQKYCDFTIVLPMKKEACIYNLAPTTSTTLTMAFGDALAVELSEHNKIGRQGFALFHPKGSLGKRLLLTVGNMISQEMNDIAVQTTDKIQNVLWQITRNRLGAVAVVNNHNELVGLITDGDIRRLLEKNESIMNMVSSEVMTQSPYSANESMLAVDAFKIMQDKKISVLPIIDEKNKLIGLVSFHDIISSGITGG